MAAMAARFRRRRPAVNLDDIDAIPPAFVRELTDKLAERCLANGLGEMMVTNHAAHVQVLDEYRTHLAIVRELMGDLLAEEYDISYASDGVEALETLHRHKDEIDLVLLDLQMPNMDGREVIARMQIDEELISIPVVILTVDQDAELDCLKIDIRISRS